MLSLVVRRLFWRALALVSLLLGLAGVFLPVLPTVPFVLIAAWAAGNGWPALESWLLDHAHLGAPLRRWRERGAVPRRAKWMATIGMSGGALTPGPAASSYLAEGRRRDNDGRGSRLTLAPAGSVTASRVPVCGTDRPL